MFFFNVCVYNMYCQCMISTIPLKPGKMLNCFISARGILTIILHCALVLFCCWFLCSFVDFYMLINHLQKKTKKNSNTF